MLLIVNQGAHLSHSGFSNKNLYALGDFLNTDFHILDFKGISNSQKETSLSRPDFSEVFESYRRDEVSESSLTLSELRSFFKKFIPIHVLFYVDYHFWPHFCQALEKPKGKMIYYSRNLLGPLIKSIENSDFLEDPRATDYLDKERIRLRVEKKAIQSCDGVIVNSKFQSKMLREFYGVDALDVVTPGIDVSLWRADPEAEIDISSQTLYFGRLDLQKGLHSIVFQANEKFPLKVIGRNFLSPMPNGVERAIHSSNAITYFPELDQERLREEMSRSCFCLFPSLYEAWSVALTEAMAMGKICIVQRGLGFEEQLKDGWNGFAIDFRGEDWTKFVGNLMERPDVLQRVRHNAIRSASQHGHTEFARKLASALRPIL